MSQPPRRPVFWFLWPRPDPHAPVDGDDEQVRWVRVTRPGPWRLAFLLPVSVLVVTLLAALVPAAAQATQPVERVAVLVAAGLASGAVLVLLMRAWVVGTYVNDRGVKVAGTWRTTVVRWHDVSAVYRGSGSARLLGLPVRRVAVRVDLVRTDGSVVPTHVTSVSPDLLGRPEAFDMAALRLQRWWEDTRRPGSR